MFFLDRGEEPISPELAKRLPLWRRVRTERLRSESARQESLCAGLLWKLAVLSRGIDPEEPVEELLAGKPVFARRKDVWFSLSHSGRYAMCAVSDAPVGADVQQMKKVNLSIARHLHPGERLWLEHTAEPLRQEEFFRLWARKEAWVKAMSEGEKLSLSQWDVTDDKAGGMCFADYTLPGGFRAAVCFGEEERVSPPVLLTAAELLDKLYKTTV